MDQAKKKQMKKIAVWVSLAALVAGLAAMPLLAKAEATSDGPVATVHYGTVEEGTVRTALHGGGTLLTEDTENINLPSGVKIEEFLVNNGDFVTAGTPLASVDKVSVMTAIVSVTETMDYLQGEIQDARDDKIDSTISATAGGRVKQVFAQKGDSVQDVMLEHGALALLSLDGLMAVKIEKKLDIVTGDTVTVTLADGEEATGRVASNLDGVIVITVEDKGYEIGQTVTVTWDGEEVGSGELYVHNAWSAVAFSGTVQTVYAKEETKVSSGASLFTLTDTDFQGTMDYMASLHREYEELLQDLFAMYRTGTIDAPCDGTVSGVDQDSPHLLAAETCEAVEAELLTVEEPKWELVLLSSTTTADSNCDPGAGEDCPATNHRPDCLKACQNGSSCNATGQHYPDCIGSCTGGSVCGAKYHKPACIESCVPVDGTCSKDAGVGYHKAACIKSCVHGSTQSECLKDASYPHYLDCIKSCTASNGTTDCPATKHLPGCIESCTHADTKDQCVAAPYHYPDCIHSCTGGEDCPASKHSDTCYFAGMTYLARVALVDQVGASELVVRWDSSGKQYEVVRTASGWAFKNPSDFNPALLVNSGKISVSNPGAYRAGDVILIINGYKGGSTDPIWNTMAVYTNLGSSATGGAGMGDLSSLLAGMAGLRGMSGLSGFSFSVETPTAGQQLFDLKGSTLMTVSPNETVSLTITLDEQDIAKVYVGQKAAVKVTALGKDTYEAVVTEIGNHGVSSGGSSKFTAKLELPKTENMLDGMSATAALELEEKTDIPTIPVMALAETGARTVVYTALDDEGQPCDPVSVTIGLSDGSVAEILEGLAVGDTYYYSYYDVLELDTGVEDRFTLS